MGAYQIIKIFIIFHLLLSSIFLLVWWIGLPFICEPDSYIFNVIFTFGEAHILEITLITNIIAILVFKGKQIIKDPQKYLFMIMFVADILQMILFAVSNISFTWLQYKNVLKENETMRLTMKLIDGTQYILSAFSILSFTFYCFYRLYMRSAGIMHVFIVHKFVIVIIMIGWAFLIGAINYVFYFESWEHVLTTIIIFIIPILMIVVSFFGNMFFNQQLGVEDTQISFLIVMLIFVSYLLLWGPFKITEMMKRYCCPIPNEYHGKILHIVAMPVAIKCFTSPLIFILVDKEFREEFFSNLIFCIPRKQTFAVSVNNNSYKFTTSSNDMKNDTENITDTGTHDDQEKLIK